MDDQLRALERAARAAPDDRTAGWALVRGLERAGDEVAAWRERCRLARAGDDEAWAELEWQPRGARTVGERVERRLPGRFELVSPGPGDVVLASPDALLALDPATLEVRWSRPVAHATAAPACASSLHVVHVEGVALVLSERRTGGEIARRGLPARAEGRGASTVAWMEATADLLIVLAGSDASVGGGWCYLVVSLVEGLDLVHRVDVSPPVLLPVLTRDLLLECLPPEGGPPAGIRPAQRVARALDGRELWRAAGGLSGHDARGVLLAATGADGVPWLRELDLAGRTRWTVEDPEPARPHLGPEHVVLVEPPYVRSGEAVIFVWTLERAQGQPGWERAFTGPRGTRLAGLAFAGDLVYLLLDHGRAAQPGGARAASLEAIDVRSGLTRWTRAVSLAARPEWPLTISLHAIDGGVLVVERSVGDGETVLHRLGAP